MPLLRIDCTTDSKLPSQTKFVKPDSVVKLTTLLAAKISRISIVGSFTIFLKRVAKTLPSLFQITTPILASSNSLNIATS